jgi:hypothetical protein
MILKARKYILVPESFSIFWDQIQGLVAARQMLYYQAITLAPKSFFFFQC